MQQDNQQEYPYQTDEIDLGKLVKRLAEYRWSIFGLAQIELLPEYIINKREVAYQYK